MVLAAFVADSKPVVYKRMSLGAIQIRLLDLDRIIEQTHSIIKVVKKGIRRGILIAETLLTTESCLLLAFLCNPRCFNANIVRRCLDKLQQECGYSTDRPTVSKALDPGLKIFGVQRLYAHRNWPAFCLLSES